MTSPDPQLLTELQARLPEADVVEILAKLGGGRWFLPTLRTFLRGRRDAAIIAGWREGKTYAELAARHQVCERTVRRLVHPPRTRAA